MKNKVLSAVVLSLVLALMATAAPLFAKESISGSSLSDAQWAALFAANYTPATPAAPEFDPESAALGVCSFTCGYCVSDFNCPFYPRERCVVYCG